MPKARTAQAKSGGVSQATNERRKTTNRKEGLRINAGYLLYKQLIMKEKYLYLLK
ncbi:hypothetical protein Belba_3311 [Belliella baltica DSM 15883]|uniref:Uncharacterized protein n=1 Tax=Belliella baltica (strain DSM 15883 / CIP 108006 / LMG 21964 / BA134) TaxID=866536 RepID=I3Z999_BELBD|nr:hypothetical protein Belba_3311 [Belliella baltica DSM 15883]